MQLICDIYFSFRYNFSVNGAEEQRVTVRLPLQEDVCIEVETNSTH